MSKVAHERALQILRAMPHPKRHSEACERMRIAYAIRWHRNELRGKQ